MLEKNLTKKLISCPKDGRVPIHNDESEAIDDVESLAQDDEVIELGVLNVEDIVREETQGQE